jgi:hypothetical protein
MEEAGVAWPDDVPLSPFMEYGRPDAFAALVGGVFREAAVEQLDWDFAFEPEEWWENVATSRVGSNGLVLSLQDPPTVARVKEAYDRRLAPFAGENGQVSVPAHALLARGIR